MVDRHFASGGIHPCDDGEWVSYDDYSALQAENERLKAERVDLEQFRESVVVARTYYAEMAGDIHDPAHNDVADCDRQLALIDAHKGE